MTLIAQKTNWVASQWANYRGEAERPQRFRLRTRGGSYRALVSRRGIEQTAPQPAFSVTGDLADDPSQL